MGKREDKQITQLLSDERFISWVRSSDPHLDLYWQRWMEDNPQKKDILSTAREIALSIGLSGESEEIFDFKEDSLQTILSASPPLKVLPKAEVKKRFTGYSYFLRIAAILVLGFGIAFIVRQRFQDHARKESLPVVRYVTKENPTGQKIKFHLPDRSIVWLNAESKLTFPEKFTDSSRTVQLEGEAFFEIKEDALKPFHVHVGDLITTVLGTTFNIRSFPDEEGQVEVSLVSGKIKVSHPVLKDENVLIPGEQAIYSKTQGKSQVKSFDIKEVTCWKEGILLFRNASFEQVKKKLERWYGVEIHTINQPGKAWNLNGEFENESIERVLERLAFMKNFTFQFKDKIVEVKF